MIPTNNGSTAPCNPISSNCVVWQGPDIPCIDICNGDTVSDVVANLATKVCELIDATCECNPVLAIDASCLTIADPTNLDQVVQALIDKVCETPDATITNIVLPKCLYYRDSLGNEVTELPLADWAVLVGNEICTIKETISIIEQNVTNLESRVAVLEECVLPCTPDEPSDFFVLSSCINAGQSIPISTLVLALESQFCSFRDVVGDIALLNSAINAQCLFASTPQLSGNGTLGNVTGWVDTPATLAESSINQWLAICDLHAAVAAIQNNCCDELCSGVTINYAYNIINNGAGIPESINLNFSASTIPAGYVDCTQNSTVTITDSNGSSVSEVISVVSLASQPSGISISLAGLNVYQALVVQVDACVSNGSSQCNDSSNISVPLSIPCPTSVSVSATANQVIVGFTNSLGQGVTYDIEAYVTGNPGDILGTATITNPPVNVQQIFPGAISTQSYTVVTSVSQGGVTRICDTQEVAALAVTCNNVQSNIAISPITSVDDIFLGYTGDLAAGTASRYSYNVGTNNVILEPNVGGVGFCYSPILSGLSMAVNGDLSLTAAWGSGAETAIELSYSTDDITYSTPDVGVDGARVLATGVTSGSVYVQAITDCGSGLSIATKWRYDFSTNSFTTIQSPSECIDSDLAIGSCPAGVQVAQQFLPCGTSTYAIPGAPATSYWFYVSKVVNASTNVTQYLYAGWDQTTGIKRVVLCCECPAFILTDTIRVFAGQENGYTTNITLPYVLGDGNPLINIITSPIGGNLTQSASSQNVFTYNTIEKVPDNYGDTFQVQIRADVGGVCSSATVTVQIQIVPAGMKMLYTDQDIFAFINTNSYSLGEATQVRDALVDLKARWNTAFGFTGEIYIIPTSNSNWLGYQKAIVDNGASAGLDGAYSGIQVLPTSWTPGGVGVYKNQAVMFVFSNDSDGVYHDSTLAAGFAGAVTQPSISYKDDYDAYKDAIAGTQNSSWGQALGLTASQYPSGISTVLFPLTVPGSSGADAANILQMIAATTGQLIPPSKFGIQTAVDVGQVIQGIGSSNPYDGATTPGGNTISGLFEFATINSHLALLDQDNTITYLTEMASGDNEDFDYLMDTAIKGNDNTFPAGTIPTNDRYIVTDCATSDVYTVSITNHGCGTIGNGTVIKLNNPGADFIPGDGRADWLTTTNKCVTVTSNCESSAAELTTTLDSTYDVCGSCTP